MPDAASSTAANGAEPSGRRPGVLLINLGTPDAPTASAVRRYLREFLSDPRVVEIPRAIWLPILYGLIMPLRPARVAGNYQKIWLDEGSPLLVHSQRLARQLARQLDGVPVALGMCYGNPSLASAIEELRSQGATEIHALPLYPQYSATTTAAAFDGIAQCYAKLRDLPGLRLIKDYHRWPAYIDALATSVTEHWNTNGRGQHLLMSFHGIPKRNTDLGDPYARQCAVTAQLLAERLNLRPEDWSLAFQSRFGKAEWLQPYADQKLQELAGLGIRTVDAICPGFAADCLETLEEIAVEYAEVFQSAGGEALRYIPALNDRADHAVALASLLQQPHNC